MNDIMHIRFNPNRRLGWNAGVGDGRFGQIGPTALAGDFESQGSILPGFASTGEALSAMNETKAYYEALDAAIKSRLGCQQTGVWPFVVWQCSTNQGLWNRWVGLSAEFLTWYDNNKNFSSRFFSPTGIYDAAQRYRKRMNDVNDEMSRAGTPTGVPKVGADPRPSGLIVDLFKDAARGAGQIVGAGAGGAAGGLASAVSANLVPLLKVGLIVGVGLIIYDKVKR